MPKYPVKTASHKVREVESKAVEVIDARRSAPFLSFRYSYTEISSLGDAPRVKSRKTSFEHGVLVSESFEGELDRNVYESVTRNTAQFFMDQTTTLMYSLLQLLPSAPKSRPDRGD
jgi:hypothetical protein